MTNKPDVIYIPEMATRLGKSEVAMRRLCQRKSKGIPKPIKVGGKWAWPRPVVDEWLKCESAG